MQQSHSLRIIHSPKHRFSIIFVWFILLSFTVDYKRLVRHFLQLLILIFKFIIYSVLTVVLIVAASASRSSDLRGISSVSEAVADSVDFTLSRSRRFSRIKYVKLKTALITNMKNPIISMTTTNSTYPLCDKL